MLNFEDPSTVVTALFEPAFVVLMTTSSMSLIPNECPLTPPRIMPPLPNVPFLIELVKVVTLSLALVLAPLTDVELLIVEKTDSVTFSFVFDPLALVLVAVLPLTSTYVVALPLSLVHLVDLPLIHISISIVHLLLVQHL